MAEKTLQFRFGDLDLTLCNRFDVADIEWMKALGARARAHPGQPFTKEEGLAYAEKIVALVVKCTRDHSPVTREQLLDELPYSAQDQADIFAALGVIFQQLLGVIPVDGHIV